MFVFSYLSVLFVWRDSVFFHIKYVASLESYPHSDSQFCLIFSSEQRSEHPVPYDVFDENVN